VAEVFWRRYSRDRSTEDAGHHDGITTPGSPASRAASVLGEFAMVADEPELAAACTVALLANDPEVRDLRLRIGTETHRRLVEALGTDADPLAVQTLLLATSGALLQAGTGHLAYDAVPALLADPRTRTSSTRTRTPSTNGSATRRRSTATTSSASGRCRATRTSSRASGTSSGYRARTACRSTPRRRGPTRTAPCRSWRSTRRCTAACVAWSPRGSPRGASPSRNPTSATSPAATSSACATPPTTSTSSPTSPGACRWTSSPS
jgi:hypothetical protein